VSLINTMAIGLRQDGDEAAVKARLALIARQTPKEGKSGQK